MVSAVCLLPAASVNQSLELYQEKLLSPGEVTWEVRAGTLQTGGTGSQESLCNTGLSGLGVQHLADQLRGHDLVPGFLH